MEQFAHKSTQVEQPKPSMECKPIVGECKKLLVVAEPFEQSIKSDKSMLAINKVRKL
jgi:hypothetical protein